MSEDRSELVLKRLRDAATAVERAQRLLASEDVSDPVAMAYLRRLLEATAVIEDRTAAERETVEPAAAYLGPLTHRTYSTAELHG